MSDLHNLVGKNLHEQGFKVQLWTRFYQTTGTDTYAGTIGYFKDEDVAIAYGESQETPERYKTDPAFILTDGKTAFAFGDSTPLTLFDSEAEAKRLRDAALGKLTPAMRKLLKL